MSWMLIFVIAAIILIPVIQEVQRRPMDSLAREGAPGQFAELPQGVTHYQWFGPVRGPLFVCVHGLTTPSFVWRRMVPGLALLGFRVLVYDHYGRGYSDRPRGLQDRVFFQRHLNDLLEHLGVQDQKFTLLGYSMGGAIVACYAAAHPEKVSRLILLAPAGMTLLPSGMVKVMRDVPILGDWIMRALYPATLRKGIKAESEPEIGPLQENELSYRGYLSAVLSSLRGVLAKDQSEEHAFLAEKGVPVLSIWAADDDVIPLRCKNTLEKWNKDAIQPVIERAGHGLAYTHADQVVAEIATFKDMR